MYTSVPFAQPFKECQDFACELNGEYEDDQIEEINHLVQDVAAEAIIRLLNFLLDAETDKQLIARIICLQKLFDNKHRQLAQTRRGPQHHDKDDQGGERPH